MVQRQIPYRSYLLRLWRDIYDDGPVWRASLESAQTGERRGFVTIHDLVQFLLAQTASDPKSHEASNEPPTGSEFG